MNGLKNGAALVGEINETTVPHGQMGLWWLGQHSFIVKVGKSVVYVDPYLSASEHRLVPPFLRPEEITNADVICGTHDHGDHIDRPVWPGLAKASPQAVFVVPELLRERLAGELALPLQRFRGVDDELPLELPGLRISAVPAAHEFLDRDAASGRYPYLGYIFEGNGCTLYHSGDTCLYEGMRAKLRRFKLDAMLLPINGRDAKRYAANIIGNMTYQEAADLAGDLRPGVVIPTHYDMFASNPGDPAAFCEYVHVKHGGLKTHICKHNELYMVVRAGR